MLEGILFDVGGVLVGQGGMLRNALAAFVGVGQVDFWNLLNEAALPACRGEESLADCWRRMANDLGVQIPEEQLRSLWIDDFREGIAPHDDVLRLARGLMGRTKVGIVSNSLAEHPTILAELGVYQAAEKGPSAALPRSRGAATYVRSTPRASARAAPCTWAFLSSLRENESFSNLLRRLRSRGAFP